MPCDDCPGEELAMPKAGPRLNYIVYTGEDYAAFYRLAATRFLKANCGTVGRSCSTTGHWSTPAEPDDIHGYERDAENPRRLRPAWPECPWRMLSVEVFSGLLDIRGICMHGKTGCGGKSITMDRCQQCPVRPIT